MVEDTKSASIDKAILARFEPVARLSPNRLDELAAVCFIEEISKDLDPTRMSTGDGQALYLAQGDLGIRYQNGNKLILRAGTDAAKHPVDTSRLAIKDTIALTNIDVVRIDIDLLDIMMTWDQLSGYPAAQAKQTVKVAQYNLNDPNNTDNPDNQIDPTSFNAFKLQGGIFSRLPTSNIEAMFQRLELIQVKAGQHIINQGQDGDYYYLIKQGTAVVTRAKDANHLPVILAEIYEGAGFGEEALASETKRNATVTMKTDGELLRLKKQDFIELLKAPVINTISLAEAKSRLTFGAVLLDVRFASEYSFDHMDGAISTPLHELRNVIPKLDASKEHIVYCQTGRRSSAAAFILAERGFKVVVIEGGARGA